MSLRSLSAVALLLACAFALPVRAADAGDAVTAARAFMAAFNKGDSRALASTCSTQASIVDDFAPHHWQGPGACADWYSAFVASAKQSGSTENVVTLGTPLVSTIDGDTAYLVFPATYASVQKGKSVKETGSIWTVALQKFASGWRIVGWTWSQTH